MTGLLNISVSAVDMAGRETPIACVINVTTQCSCLKCVNMPDKDSVCVPGWLFSLCCAKKRVGWSETVIEADLL